MHAFAAAQGWRSLDCGDVVHLCVAVAAMPKKVGRKQADVPPSARTKKQRREQAERDPSDDEDGEAYDDDGLIPAALTHKIAAQAQAQLKEEAGAGDGGGSSFRTGSRPGDLAEFGSDGEGDDGADDDDDDELAGAGEFYEEELELDEGEDSQALDALLGGGRTLNLGDIIMAKIAERNEAAAAAAAADGAKPDGAAVGKASGLPDKVVEVYTQVGKLLHTYRSGQVPKALKIVPRLANWEEVLYVTEPEMWSPAAMREATRLFASNLNSAMAQRFFNLVLLPAVLDDIKSHKKLNFHLYLALKKALYKPSAFFKGVLLPMCEDRCTLREALIVCSVLQKVSVPMLHSAVAILKLAEMPFSPPNALFMRTLLLKKYALPYRVVDSLVDYFVSFTDAEAVPPVLWQQMLLAFAQHYKAEVTSEQKEALKRLLRAQQHATITPEIRRELFSARSRGDPYVPPIAGDDAAAAPME